MADSLSKPKIKTRNLMWEYLDQFSVGPPVARGTNFENLTKGQLGGWEIHSRNGTVDNVVDTELEAFAEIRRF
ncbi:hypothetical protein V5O48_010924 [Marasmius crinis-equi]|uniref:Uncharacterized protein n=1 Tax=Marasmius crinis-equi TaxID=585013 RepID=A0ABR3F7C6_9AGAR